MKAARSRWAIWCFTGGNALGALSLLAGIALSAGVPRELVGTWGVAATTGNYCNPLSECTAGSGGSASFTFKADGQAEYAQFQAALVDGCGEVRTLTHQYGTISVEDLRIVFTPTAGTYTSVNGCRPDLTGNWTFEPKDLKPISMSWKFVADPEDPTKLALELVDGNQQASGTYRRR